jgi:hypothetical protein
MLKQGWQKPVVVKGNGRARKFGPRLPKGFKRERIKPQRKLSARARKQLMLKQGWLAPIHVKGAKVKVKRPRKPKMKRPRKPKKPRVKKARSSSAKRVRQPRARRLRTRSAGSYLPRGKTIRWGALWAMVRKFAHAVRGGKGAGDGRNHGYTGSGYKGRTGFAGMKPKGHLW